MIPAIPLLGIYLKEYKMFYYKDTFMCMFIAVLFKIAKIRNQHKYPSIKKMWCIYTSEYYAAAEKNQSFC